MEESYILDGSSEDTERIAREMFGLEAGQTWDDIEIPDDDDEAGFHLFSRKIKHFND